MYKKDVLEYYEFGAEVARVLGLKSRSTITMWGDVIPEINALKLARITRGRLKFNPSLYL
jgi:hypothetical protein